MKNLILLSLFFILIIAACRTAKTPLDPECMGTAQTDSVCTQVYQPVCGCNNITYGNECEARRAGAKSWRNGECTTGN